MFTLNNSPWTSSNNSCLKFALREQNFSLVIPRSITSQYDFPSTPTGIVIFFVSSDTSFFYHPSIYSNSLVASCFLAKWLLLHKQQLFADLSGLLGSNSPYSILLIHFPPWLHMMARFYIGCNCTQPVLSEGVSFFDFEPQSPQYIGTFPVRRHSWCWCQWRYGCCVGIILFFMLSHHCWWTMQSQDDSQSYDFTKNEELCIIHGVDSVDSDQCPNGLHKFVM